MKINYMRAARTLARTTYAYDAEMKLELEGNKYVYLHANYYDGSHFTVAEASFFESMVNPESEVQEVDFLEEYEELEEAEESTYYELFLALDAFVDYYIQWRKTSGDEWLLNVLEPNPNDYVLL